MCRIGSIFWLGLVDIEGNVDFFLLYIFVMIVILLVGFFVGMNDIVSYNVGYFSWFVLIGSYFIFVVF